MAVAQSHYFPRDDDSTASDTSFTLLRGAPPASGSGDSLLTRSTHLAALLPGAEGAVLSVAISSALRLCASGSVDGTVALYTLRDGKRVRVLREPSSASVEQV